VFRTGQGWKVSVPRLAAQATTAGSVGQTSSAERPLGNSMRAVFTHSGAPLGTRFWKKASPPWLCWVDSLAPSKTPAGQRSRVVGRLRSARRIPSATDT
jgi:NAD(P)H-dependent flavin oxidoreductase YrpB (nitropropane dioxygenase family)